MRKGKWSTFAAIALFILLDALKTNVQEISLPGTWTGKSHFNKQVKISI